MCATTYRFGVSRAITLITCLKSVDGLTKASRKEKYMTLGTVLLIVLVLLLIGAIPTWPHSRGWGYGPSGILGAILVVVLILFLLGRI